MLTEAHRALTAVTKSLDPGQQMSTVADIRQALRFASADLKEDLLPGFCLPKGIAPLLPIFRESILNGAPGNDASLYIKLCVRPSVCLCVTHEL